MADQSLITRLRGVARDRVGPTEQSMIIAWAGFGVTFGVTTATATATAYGSGAAQIVDELALLIDLEDVYWSREGRTSVKAAIGLLALGGVYLAAVPFWHGAARELLPTRPASPAAK